MCDDWTDAVGADWVECLRRGRQIKQRASELRRDGRAEEAIALLEHALERLGVLVSNGVELSIGSFWRGSYSYAWPVIFFDVYIRLLIETGDFDAARRLANEGLSEGSLKADAVLMIQKRLAALDNKKGPAQRFRTERVAKRDLEERYLCQGAIEMVALYYLRERLDLEGVVAEVDMWRLILGFLTGEVGTQQLSDAYAEATGESLPQAFAEVLSANSREFEAACTAPLGATVGQVGYPDLILFDPVTLGGVRFVEVKDVHDRLRPHQEAVLNNFVAAGLSCSVLRFV